MADTQDRKDPSSGAAESGDPGQRLPRRYKLYDKIKDHVSLRAIDTVIIVTALAIVILLAVGILTSNQG